jgi:hypothetical protein
VFEGWPVEYGIEAWFRYKIDNGHLRLAAKLKPTRRVLLSAWDRLLEEVRDTLDFGQESVVFPVLVEG